MNNELIPFDLESALAGDEVITRKGKEATQLTLFYTKEGAHSLCGVIDGMIYSFTRDGKCSKYGDKNKFDLFMAPKKPTTTAESKKMNNELIPFDLDRALAGDKVITHDGREVSQLTLFCTKEGAYSLCAVIDGRIYNFTRDGKYGGECKYDLFMAPKTRVMYVNAWMSNGELEASAYNTIEEAKAATTPLNYYIWIAQEITFKEGE